MVGIRNARRLDTCGDGDEVWVRAKVLGDDYGGENAQIKILHASSVLEGTIGGVGVVVLPYEHLFVEE